MDAQRRIYPDIEGDFIVAVDQYGIGSRKANDIAQTFPDDFIHSPLGLKILLEKTIDEYGVNSQHVKELIEKDADNEEFLLLALTVFDKALARDARMKEWHAHNKEKSGMLTKVVNQYASSLKYGGGIGTVLMTLLECNNIVAAGIVLSSSFLPSALIMAIDKLKALHEEKKEVDDIFTSLLPKNGSSSDNGAPGQSFDV